MPLASGSGTLTEISVPLNAHTAQLTASATALTTLATIETTRLAEETALGIATAVEVGLQITQLGLYYDAFDDRIDDRDDKIDDQIDFLQALDNYKVGQDLGMLTVKSSVLTGMGLPSVNRCSDAVRHRSESVGDGAAVDLKASQFADQSCNGVPNGWGLHEGSLMAAKSGSYAGGILGNSAARQQEVVREQKTSIARAAHAGLKSVFNSTDILARYQQAASIHSGLADIFLTGFNSAGAALGASIGRLTASSGNTNSLEANSTGQSLVDFSGFA